MQHHPSMVIRSAGNRQRLPQLTEKATPQGTRFCSDQTLHFGAMAFRLSIAVQIYVDVVAGDRRDRHGRHDERQFAHNQPMKNPQAREYVCLCRAGN